MTDLSEITTREFAKEYKTLGLEENKKIAHDGGEVAKVARDNIENKLSKSIISKGNSLNY